MFRNYVNESLDLNQYNQIMKKAPENQKYCNAFCQKFMEISDFYEGKSNCKECFNYIIKIRKMIDNNQLTAEQFKANPSLVIRDKVIIPVNKNCIACKKDLTLDKFEDRRKECIQCRRGKKKINYEEQFEEYKAAIEEVKTDITALTNLLRAMSIDLLKLVKKEYKISVSHSDLKKDILLVKIVDYFRSLLNPYICLGNCGCRLPTQFSVCDVCKLNPKNSAEEIMLEFEKNLDELVEELDQMKPEDSFKYNKKQIVLIAKKLGVKFYQTQDKPIIMELIDTHLQKKKEDEKQTILKDLGGEISLNGISVLSREDGFINATAMCKAGNKKFNDWLRLESTKELIEALEEAINCEVGIPTDLKNAETGIPVFAIPAFKNNNVEIPVDNNLKVDNSIFKIRSAGIPADLIKYEVIHVVKNGINDKRGSWIHPDLAVQLAQWISPIFSLQVSKWVRELALCGSVSIGKEKTSQQLLELQKDFKKLEEKHRKLLQKKQYYKFKEGPAFYIISDIDGKSVKFKPGFEGVDIDTRLQQHRSTTPGIKLEYLIYSKDASLVETAILKRFESKRKVANHEWIFDVDVNYIIKSTRTILDILNIEYIEEKSIEEYNNQIMLDFE